MGIKKWAAIGLAVATLALGGCNQTGGGSATCYQNPQNGNVGCAGTNGNGDACVGGVYNGEAWVHCND